MTRSHTGSVAFILLALSASFFLGWIACPDTGLAAGICGSWAITPTPNVGNSVTRLTSITALSPADAWSVGYWRNEPAGIGSLAVHWDGSNWGLVNLPSTDQLGTQPQTLGVDHAPNGDVWIAGYLTTTYPTNNLPLVIRRRGGSWDYVNTVTLRPQTEYPFAARGGFANEVAAISDDDVWVVGLANGFGDAQASSVPMALHWDGSDWTDVNVPIISNRHHELDDVVAIASDDVWAVGDYRFVAGVYRGVTYHWNGTEWSHIHSPIEELSQSGLNDVAATGPNDVWALGGSADQIVLMHWDGSSWSFAEAPPHSVGGTLVAAAPNDLWVSGWNGYWHWDGLSWSEVPLAVPGSTYVIRGGAMEIVGGCDIWSVGFWTLPDGVTSFSLAERLQSGFADVADGAGDVSPGAGLVFPNPYRPGDAIHLSLPGGSQSAVLTVHDILGRAIRREEVGATAVWSWDGRGDAGDAAPAGVYLLRLESGDVATTRKLVLR